jgi:hypothetical protein
MSTEQKETVEVPQSLRAYVAKWACAREAERIAARKSSSAEELQAFYRDMLAEFDSLTDRIGHRSVGDLTAAELPVLHLLLSFVEVSQMIEVFGAAPMDPKAYPEGLMKALM